MEATGNFPRQIIPLICNIRTTWMHFLLHLFTANHWWPRVQQGRCQVEEEAVNCGSLNNQMLTNRHHKCIIHIINQPLIIRKESVIRIWYTVIHKCACKLFTTDTINYYCYYYSHACLYIVIFYTCIFPRPLFLLSRLSIMIVIITWRTFLLKRQYSK